MLDVGALKGVCAPRVRGPPEEADPPNHWDERNWGAKEGGGHIVSKHLEETWVLQEHKVAGTRQGQWAPQGVLAF